jgi:hypothetical protein
MKTSSRDAGGAIVAVVVVFLMLILLIMGGGFFFIVSNQRAGAIESMQRVVMAEQRALVMAQEQRAIAIREQAVANKAIADAELLAPTNSDKTTDSTATAGGDGEPVDGQTTTISQLGWLVNHWQHVEGKTSSEEHWIAPRGGIMLGVNRSVNGKGRTMFEFLRIEATEDDGLVYYASPMGRGKTAFTLLEVGPDRVVFENAEHDFPQRIIYWLDDQGRLHARIEGEIGGKPRQSEWTWTAQR